MPVDPNPNSSSDPIPPKAAVKRKRSLPGTPDPEAEVIALWPSTLLAASTFACEVCGREFLRDQNLQIHLRGHNLPWNLAPKKGGDAAGGGTEAARKRVYVCPETTCLYHDPGRALGDLTGIKKHYSRKHGEKTRECGKCSKRYAVRTDWKVHSRLCGNRNYECPCGTLFSRKDSYSVHRASCETVAVEEDGGENGIEFKANTVNHELLFPSLWGKTSVKPEDNEDDN